MVFIAKEVPTGVIDGVNTTFTLLNDVDYTTSLYIDGAIYVDFTPSGRVLSLTDAPTSTIFVDYYTADSVLPIVTNTNLGDVKTKIWALLGQRADVGNFGSDIVTGEINDVMEDIWRGKVMNSITGKYLMSGGMYFQENYYSFRISGESHTTADVEIGDTSISMPTSKLNAQGWLMIGGDYIQYTSVTETSIEGVSGITTTHKSGVSAIQLYALPENYDIIIEMDEVRYNYSGVSYTPVDTEGRVKFDVIRVGSVPLLKIDGLREETIIRTRYSVKYVDVNDDSEDFPLPDRYGTSMVAYLVAGQMAYDKLMPQGDRLLQTGYNRLLQMWDFYNKKTTNKTKFRPKPYSKIGRTSR